MEEKTMKNQRNTDLSVDEMARELAAMAREFLVAEVAEEKDGFSVCFSDGQEFLVSVCRKGQNP